MTVTSMILLLGLISSVAYWALLVFYRQAWRRLPTIQVAPAFVPSTKIAVLVPARNEAQHIQACIRSILANRYPQDLLEVIFINDHSSDETLALGQTIAHPSLRIINLPANKTGKKTAIATAIANTSAELIVTTDADVVVPDSWLYTLAAHYEATQADMIAAPVIFDNQHDFLTQFQALDFCGLMVITGGGIQSQLSLMCNGANLAYTRAVFEEVGGFAGVDDIASGDDILLMQKLIERGKTITFLKSKAALVISQPQTQYADFGAQRLRWAAKSGRLRQKGLFFSQAIVFAANVAVLSLFVLLFVLPWSWLTVIALVGIAIKCIADYGLLKESTTFFEKQYLMRVFGRATLFTVVYILWVALASFFIKKHHWKGRFLR